jgi:colicin import membrane protein
LALRKKFSALTVAATLLTGCAIVGAQPVAATGAVTSAAEQALATQFPPKSIDTIERANAALALVPVARAEIERRIASQRFQCYEDFFTSSCLNDLRDAERRANKAVRRVEVEANALLRRERAAERDRAVAERERRAAEQRAKSISITGSARNAENAGTGESAPVTPPNESAPADEPRP